MSFVEEEIDRMNESFLQLSVQLQKRSPVSTQLRESENRAGDSSGVIRRNVARRIPESLALVLLLWSRCAAVCF